MRFLSGLASASLNASADESLTSLEERVTQERVEEGERARSVPDIPDPKSVTYVDYEDPFSFVDDAFGAPHIRKLSQYAWLGLGGDAYLLECLGKGFVRVEQTESDTGQPLPNHLYADQTG